MPCFHGVTITSGLQKPETAGSELAPWRENPYRLFSWWDVDKFSAEKFFILGNLVSTVRDKISMVAILPEQKEKIIRDAQSALPLIEHLCTEINLTFVLAAVPESKRDCPGRC